VFEYSNMDEIFNNIYFKLAIAMIMSLILAFSDEIDVLKNKILTWCIFLLVLMMTCFNMTDDQGVIFLLIAVFIVSLNV
jgi:hypothetical protein